MARQTTFQDGWKIKKKKKEEKEKDMTLKFLHHCWEVDIVQGCPMWKGCFLHISNKDEWGTRDRARLIPSPLILALLHL